MPDVVSYPSADFYDQATMGCKNLPLSVRVRLDDLSISDVRMGVNEVAQPIEWEPASEWLCWRVGCWGRHD